jgi:hypothetical protein
MTLPSEPSGDALERRVAALEERLHAAEDRLEIQRLIAAYGPAVDSGRSAAAAALWTRDGAYDTYPAPARGTEAIAALFDADLHRSLVRGGCAHLQATPHIELDGDRAVATFHSLLLTRDEATDGFRVWRASANRCELTREPGGWRVQRRVNRVLDGGAEARDLLRRAVEPDDG